MGRIKYLTGFLCLFLFAFYSCNKDAVPVDVNCIECINVNSDTGKITEISIELTLNNENDSILVTVYKGKYNTDETQNNKLDDTIVGVKELKLDLPVNEYYSFKAEYNYDGKKINVIDGNYLKRHTIKDVCDFECYIYTGDYINLTFKFE